MSEHEETDLQGLHQAVLREQAEPVEGLEPVPMWMKVIMILLVAWGGWYLGRYDANFEPQRSDMEALATNAVAAEAPAAGGEVDLARGAELYTSRCAACHQGSGQGMAGLAPTLDGSDWVSGPADKMIRVVLHGLTGPIEVNGEPFVGTMPPWGPSMTDGEIASVISYVRTAWSNDASHIQEADVTSIRDADDRSTPWTAAEL